MLPHLLVVGVGNAEEQSPAGSCMRLSEERGGGGGLFSIEFGPPPPSQVSLTPPGLTGSDSDRLMEMKEEDCYLIGSREALPSGGQIVVCGPRRCIASLGY